ncbi:MAG: DUF4271 domain-containing protein [Cyclobacteriaceae bacterium]
MKHIILAVFLSLCFLVSRSQTDTILVENLRYSWVYQNEQNKVEPVSGLSGLTSVSFHIPTDNGEFLRICNDNPYDLWVNLKLLSSESENCITYSLDSIMRVVSSDSLFFHVVSSKGLTSLTTELMAVTEMEPDEVVIESRFSADFRNYYLTVLSLFLLLVAISRRLYPFRLAATLSNPFKATASVEEYHFDFFTISNLFFVFIFSFLAAFVVQFMEICNNWENFGGLKFIDLLGLWSFKLVLIFGVVLIKYILSIVVAQIFSLRGVPGVHNQDLINYLFWIFVLLAVITLGQYSLRTEGDSDIARIMIVILAISLLIFQAGIYLKVSKITSLNKMLIISYLCVTEFLPGFILIYLLSE